MDWDDIYTDHVDSDTEIKGFSGDNRWLSNFYSCTVVHDGLYYPSSEAAYQAAKTLDINIRDNFRNMTASEAKKAGKKLVLRDDWDEVKVDIMTDIIRDKFTRNLDLQKKLLGTDGKYLEETNWWGDTFWGVCKGVGKNNLGRVLMRVREELKYGKTDKVGLYSVRVPAIDGKGDYEGTHPFRKEPTSEDIDSLLLAIRPSREYSVLAEKKITFLRWLEPHEI